MESHADTLQRNKKGRRELPPSATARTLSDNETVGLRVMGLTDSELLRDAQQ